MWRDTIDLLRHFGKDTNSPKYVCPSDLKAGCAGSVLNLLEMDGFNHKVEVIRGVLQEECSSMLSDFFKELREKKKMLKKSLAEQVGNSEK